MLLKWIPHSCSCDPQLLLFWWIPHSFDPQSSMSWRLRAGEGGGEACCQLPSFPQYKSPSPSLTHTPNLPIYEPGRLAFPKVHATMSACLYSPRRSIERATIPPAFTAVESVTLPPPPPHGRFAARALTSPLPPTPTTALYLAAPLQPTLNMVCTSCRL